MPIKGMDAGFKNSKIQSVVSLCIKATSSFFFFSDTQRLLEAGRSLSPETTLLIRFVHANRHHGRNSFTANKSVPTVQLPRKCILPLFLAEPRALRGPGGSCTDCAFWQSLSLLLAARACDQAQSEIIRPSCTSCRMASLWVGRPWWASQRLCVRSFFSPFRQWAGSGRGLAGRRHTWRGIQSANLAGLDSHSSAVHSLLAV